MPSRTDIVFHGNLLNRNPISYRRIADAISYYTDIGYEYVEVPWVVPMWAIEATCPTPETVPLIFDRGLVGSAEQSFIFLDSTGSLPKGKYVACSPCFRVGDNDGYLHQSEFMKVELFSNIIVDRYALDEMVMEAMEFFRQQLTRRPYALARADEDRHMADINLNGIEIGSYGLRELNDLRWVYGTAVAEPRFSMAMLRDPGGDETYDWLSEEVDGC